MRYLVTLTPLEPFLFGGDNTFGKLGDALKGTYLVKSREFPQQSAILGMLRKEIMTQSGLLTRKIRGEWVDPSSKQKAQQLAGKGKFSITAQEVGDFGNIKSVGPVFLMQKGKRFIKKVKAGTYQDGLLESFDPKNDIFDNYICIEDGEEKSSSDIFNAIQQIGNKKEATEDDPKKENSLFKKTSYMLNDDFKFAFYLESDYRLQNSIITLGADRSSFRLEAKEDDTSLDYKEPNGYLVLLGDAYITIPLKGNCRFAITSEISYQNLQNKKHATKHNEFKKSDKVFLYEKGSLIIEPTQALLDNLNNANLQKIGYNKYTLKGK